MTAHHKIEIDEECQTCGGTGLYSGMAETKNCAVVCHICKGTGCNHFVHEYDDFNSRKVNPEIEYVYQANPGIKIGREYRYLFKDFGGMPFKDWDAGKPFVVGMENRRFTCPAWWYQSVDYKLKPNWDDSERKCISTGASFSGCDFFIHKAGCWEKFDHEKYK